MVILNNAAMQINNKIKIQAFVSIINHRTTLSVNIQKYSIFVGHNSLSIEH